MAKAYIKKNVVWFRTGVQKAGNSPTPEVFDKARLESWVENFGLLPFKPPINFGRHVKSSAEVPVTDIEELLLKQSDGNMTPLFGQIEKLRLIEDKEAPGEYFLVSDIRGKDKDQVEAIGINFPGRSVTLRKKIGEDGKAKEYISSGTFLGKAEPPAVEGLPSPPSTVIEAAVFQKYMDEEVDSENEALTVVMDSPDIEEDSAQSNNNRQEGVKMTSEKDKSLVEPLGEATATLAALKKTAEDGAGLNLSFSKTLEQANAEVEKYRKLNESYKAQLEESEHKRIEGEVLSFSKSLVEKYGLTKVHAERVRQLGVAMSFGRDKLTFSGEADERPLVEQFKLTFSQLCEEGVKAFVPKSESTPAEDGAAPTAGGGKPPETDDEIFTFSQAGPIVMPDASARLIANDPKLSAEAKLQVIKDWKEAHK